VLLPEVPHYDTAPSLSAIDATELTAQRFRRELLEPMRPCLIRGAVRHWPAFNKWKDVDYLRQCVGNPHVVVTTAPLVQPPHSPVNDEAHRQGAFFDLLAELTSGRRGHYVLHAPLRSNSPLSPLAEDVLGFPFLKMVRPPFSYPPKRAYLYLDSYTDWHYHFTDETLMCQVKGTKEVLLLPPDRVSFDLLNSIRKSTGAMWNVDVRQFPQWANIRPFRALVSPGDALYIPTFWWHAVESVDGEFGWTVAWCWGTPLHLFDPRLPGVRRTLHTSLGSRYAPLALAAAAWSLLSLKRLGRPPYAV